MEIFQYSNLSPAQIEEISNIYNSTLAVIRNVSEPWFLLFMVNDNFQVGYLAAGNENADPLVQFHQDFMGYLQSSQTHYQDGFSNIELPFAIADLQNLNPLELYERLVLCLSQEVEILRSFWLQNPNPYFNDSSEASMRQVLEALPDKASECEMASQSVIFFSELDQHQNGNQHQVSPVPYLKVKVLYLVTLISRQLNRQSNILLNYPNLQRVLKWSEEDAKNWSRFSLETVKTWFSSLLGPLDGFTQFWNADQFQRVRNSHPNPNSHTLAWNKATDLVENSRQSMRNVLCNALALETQPPRVIQEGAPVSFSLLLFIPQSIFDRDVSNVSIQYKILDKRTAQQLFTSQINVGQINDFDTVPNPEFNSVRYSNYINLKFRRSIRMQRRGRDGSVLRQYLCLLFCVRFQHKGHRIRAWCCSGSFVYIKGNIQRSEAEGAMVWYNLFRHREGENRNENVNPNPNPNWLPLEVDEHVDVSRIGPALSRYFNDKMGTNREFTRENCEHLLGKLLRARKPETPGQRSEQLTEDAQAQTTKVSISMFLDKTEKRKIERRNETKIERYSFWDWFSQTVEFAKKHLALFWKKGFLVEYIDRISAEDVILQGQPPRTFFLRFSDRLPAAISVCFVDSRGAAASIQPFTDQDLQNVSLLQRIHDLFGFKSFLYHHVQEEEEDGQKISLILPWGDRDISEFALPPRQGYVPDPLTNRPYVALHAHTLILPDPLTEDTKSMEIQVSIPSPVEPNLENPLVGFEDGDVMEMTEEEWQNFQSS